ncbi:MAG: hypothetical protein ABI878_13360 [Acidobacteriota bacterium]
MTSTKHSPVIFLMLIVLFAGSSVAQIRTLTLPKPAQPTPPSPRGNIKLLDGYVYGERKGIDAAVGSFNRDDGFKITYLIGSNVGDLGPYHRNVDRGTVLWRKTLRLSGDLVTVMYFEDGRINAFFTEARANFDADTKTAEDISDFLLMVTQYSPTHTDPKTLQKKT